MLTKIKSKIKYLIRSFVFNNYQNSALFRKLYWDERAVDIKSKYNFHQNDFDYLKQLIREIKPSNLLEIGCGSGRLLPVYLSFPFIKDIYLQDISHKALELIESNDKRIKRISDSIMVLEKIIPKMELIISNRVLQHVPANQIEKNINGICRLSDLIYINELSISDGLMPNSYMKIHDYQAMFKQEGFEVSQTGFINKQLYFVFKKIEE